MKDWLKKILPAVIIAAGLGLIGWGVKAGFSKIADNSRTIFVRGLAEREVPADKITWPIVYTLSGNDLAELYTQMESSNKTIINFLTQNGVGEEEISVNAPDLYDQLSNVYGSRDYNYRFNMTTVIVVTSNEVQKVDALIKRQGELIKQGISLKTEEYSNPTIYEFTGLNDIKPEMIAEATRNARDAAQKFADDSDSSIGKIKSATQGQFSIENRDSYTPSIKNVRVVTTIEYFIED